MKKHITAKDIANTARMMRTLHSGVILIIEGNTDMRVYTRFIDKTNCGSIPSNGKDNAITALAILEKSNFRGVLIIVDADLWKLDGIKPTSSNILLTDTHDLETMIISSDTFEKILSEFGAGGKIKKLDKPVRSMLLESALPIGFFRWLSSPTKDNLSLKFKGMSFDNFVDKKTLSVDIDNLVKEVKANSQNSTLDKNVIKRKIAILKNVGYDPWQVCSGHDLIQILSIGLRYIFGNKRAENITSEAVDGMLRLAYDYSCFCLTQLYSSIKEWEKANPNFKILK